MQMKDVIISVIGLQQAEDFEPVELVTAGHYGVSADEMRLAWEESELTGLEGTKTSVTVQPGSVVLERQGKLNTRMEFQEGKKNYFLYETPFGSTEMGLKTTRIRSSLGLHGGEVLVDYSLDMNHETLGHNRFYIKVEEPKKSHTGDLRWPI